MSAVIQAGHALDPGRRGAANRLLEIKHDQLMPRAVNVAYSSSEVSTGDREID